MRTYIWTGNKGEKVLSYDENFKKWQKSGESKTSGGVKIGVFRFVAVLLFCISTSPLWAADLNSAYIPCQCATFNSSDSDAGDCFYHNGLSEYDKYRLNSIGVTGDENRCKAVAGCKYNDECEKGSSDYYTDYTTGGQDYTPQRCPEGFPNSAAGSWDQNQCYYTTNCAGANQHSASTDTPHTCRVYYGGKVVCKNDNPQPTCGGAWGTNSYSNGICNLNQASSEGFNSNDGNLNYDYHIEGSGTSAKCYSNTRNCNLFTVGNTSIRGVDGQARWYNSQRKWEVDNQTYGCKKTETNKEIGTLIDDNGRCEVNCYATQVSSPRPGTTVDNATDNIAYDRINSYFCTGCIDDENVARVPTADTNCIIGSRAYCSRNDASCKCKPVPRGYYKSPNNCSWDNNTGTLPNCTAACGPGQTTNEGGGATSEADCHYTTQTRFCDAHGCFYLSDLSWDATNNYTWGGATSPSPGQQ